LTAPAIGALSSRLGTVRVTHWLSRIARHGAIDSLKRRQARPQRSLPATHEEADPFAEFSCSDAGPSESLILQRQAAEVR